MNNTIEHNLLKRFFSTLVLSSIFIIFFIVIVIYMVINQEKNELKLKNEHYSALLVSSIDTMLHELKVSLLSDTLEQRSSMFFKNHEFLHAIYLLDKNHKILNSYTRNDDYIVEPNFLLRKLDNGEMLIDRFIYDDNSEAYELVAYNLNDKILIMLLNIKKMAHFVLDGSKNSYMVDKAGFIYGEVNDNARLNIYDELDLDDDWKISHADFSVFKSKDAWVYYTVNYLPNLKIAVFSEVKISEIFKKYLLVSILIFVCLALLLFIFAESFFYIRKCIIVPLRKFKVFLKNFEKSKFIIQDFEQNSDFSKFYDSLSRIFYNIKNLEQDLGFYKNEHELLFENSDLMIIYVNAKNDRIVSCSNAALEFYKYSEDEFLTKNFFDLEDESLYSSYLADFTNSADVVHVHKTRLGERRFVSISRGHMIKDLVAFHVYVINDLTNTIRLHSMLKDMANVAGAGPCLILSLNKKLEVIGATQNIIDILGYNREYIIQKTLRLSDIISDKGKLTDLERHFNSHSDAVIDDVLQIIRENGQKVWHIIRFEPLDEKKRASGDIWAYMYFRDVSSIYKELRALKSDLELQREQLQGSSLMAWKYDVETGLFDLPISFFDLLGQNKLNTTLTAKILPKYIEKNYVDLLSTEIEQAIKNNKHTIDIELKAISRLQVDLWLKFKGHFAKIKTKDQEEKEVVLGVIEDISDKIIEEARLNLLATIFDNSKESIIITDERTNIIRVNSAFTDTTGYSEDEVLGQHPSLLNLGRYNKVFFKNMRRSLEKTGSWKGEVYDIRKDGTEFPQILSISAVRDRTGKVTNYIGISTDITDIKAKEQELEKIAYYDALTGLPNKRKFLKLLAKNIEEATINNKKFALFFVDLDGFKAANDTYGHNCGDEVLKLVGNRLEAIAHKKNNMIAIMEHKGNIVSRFGGDEFLLIIKDFDDLNYVRKLADEIIDRIGRVFIIGNYNVYIGATIGITYFPQINIVNIDILLEQADWAMYQAKLAGKNRYYEFNDTSAMIFKEYKNLLSRFESFDEENFVVIYQPVYDIARKKVLAFEVGINLKDTKTKLSASDLSNLLSQKHWFVDLNIWIIKSAYEAFRKDELYDVNIDINIPISQLNSNAFYRKFKEFAKDKYLGNMRILVNDIFTMRNPANEVNEVVNRYKEFGIDFMVDELDEKTIELASELKVSNMRVTRAYTKGLLKELGIIDKLSDMLDTCKAENKILYTKNVENAQIFKILSLIGFEFMTGDFIYPAVSGGGLNEATLELSKKEKIFAKLTSSDSKSKTSMMNLFKFLIFMSYQLENILQLVNDKNLKLFNKNQYENTFVSLRKAQDEDLAFVCDDANEIITNILKLKNTAKADENIDISAIKQQIIDEQNRLINLISGE
ncbi:diguanylate cyclase domain-containing protein [Campylobacter sp.]|uniref:diguanylate cyclase domain-containing protein n=1 Tax=Campylobacter sp. TaxID=205 RepID=UPI002A582CF9|nr:diguanylate cyclase [Campylobacter sp.]MDD7091103.1 diguanylate cyclase [Campylobacteraceae bacterium]MDY5285752.1 diguanylate cyclase [Campylobacter sp.]